MMATDLLLLLESVPVASLLKRKANSSGVFNANSSLSFSPGPRPMLPNYIEESSNKVLTISLSGGEKPMTTWFNSDWWPLTYILPAGRTDIAVVNFGFWKASSMITHLLVVVV
jgi:hypothetical protein